MDPYQQSFIELAESVGALAFGEFQLKSGRTSPYFFNAGKFNTGQALATIGKCYADKIVDTGIRFDMLYGPAYKGIPLVASTANALALDHGIDVPYSFNRKEAKSHGEGGIFVGAKPAGRVLVLDDVITAGTAIRESLELLRGTAGVEVVDVLIGLDRQEQGPSGLSAIDQLAKEADLKVHSIIHLNDLIDYLSNNSPQMSNESQPDLLDSLKRYREKYGTD